MLANVRKVMGKGVGPQHTSVYSKPLILKILTAVDHFIVLHTVYHMGCSEFSKIAENVCCVSSGL